MSKKAGISLGIGLVVLILIVWVGLTVSAITGESSKADAYLKNAVAQKLPQTEVSQKLKDMGFEMTDAQGSSTGTGPVHSVIVYSTHLVVNLTFNPDGTTHSYHLDKS